MAFMAVLESDLRALSAEARRKYPAVKDAAEHAILKLRSLSSSSEIALNEDILHIFLMACEVKSLKLSVISLACLQKLISHNAIAPSALREILPTLKGHAEVADESVQLKTLQTILIIFQSQLDPDNEGNVAQALGICLQLLENNRSSDSVRNTAAATFRQAVALIFDHVLCAESLPAGKLGFGNHVFRTNSVIDDVSHSVNRSLLLEAELLSDRPKALRESLTKAGKLGLLLLEDLTALAAGGSAIWLRVTSIHRTFALDILEFILSHYVAVFRTLVSYEQLLRHQICSLLMTSLRTNVELEGEVGEPLFRRLVLRSVAHVIKLYSSSLVTECEVFLNMLLKVTSLDLPLWHRILVLEVLRGFCVEVQTLRLLFQNFDMHPKNTNVVENIVKALARVVSSIQVPDTSEESLAAVAGMFNSKAKGIEWSLDNDASNAAVIVASEAHAITLAVEGLLGVVFTVATLTDEAVDVGEIESPRYDSNPSEKFTGKTAILCTAMVDSIWLTILDALSLILKRSQGEAIIVEILKGYQAFTQACGVLHAVEPLNSFLASLCKFTISYPNEHDRRSLLVSPGSRRFENFGDQRDYVVLTLKNVQALRTLFNIAHRLHNVLGPSWILVLETLAALDRAIHSPHATTQIFTYDNDNFSMRKLKEVLPGEGCGIIVMDATACCHSETDSCSDGNVQEASSTVPRLTKEISGQYSDFSILSSLSSQLFESSALMHLSAVKSLLSALCQLSNQCMSGSFSGSGQTSIQQIGSITFAVERMISVLVNNLHRVEPLWDQVVGHLLELAESSSSHLRNVALDALDQSICAVLGSDQFHSSRNHFADCKMDPLHMDRRGFECSVISPLKSLYISTQNVDIRAGSLKILLHVLERHGEKLYYSWPNILEMLRLVADASEKDLIPLGFQSIRVIMNDGLSTIPAHCLDECVEVAGAFSSQKTEINISLTAIGLLWMATDFIARGLVPLHNEEKKPGVTSDIQPTPKQTEHVATLHEQETQTSDEIHDRVCIINAIDCDRLLLLVFSILQELAADERPEVRNSAIRTLFQTLGSHGQKLSSRMWESCLWNYVFPILDRVNHLAATSSKDEWQGKELGTRGGKTVHMLIHHSRNTAQKQWDETLVLVLGGISRLLRSFFPLLQSLSNFWAGWESLLRFVRNSISNGSKEVAVAAINCLQTTVICHCPKGNLPMPYLKSVLGVYDFVLKESLNYRSNATSKVKQEILNSLGDLYVQAQEMFDNDMYLQLLEIMKVAARESESTADNTEAEFGNVSPVQRTMLEILPLLRPTEKISSMWSNLLCELLLYLPGSENLPHEQEDDMKHASCIDHNLKSVEMASQLDVHSLSEKQRVEISKSIPSETVGTESKFPYGSAVLLPVEFMTSDKTVAVTNHLLGEKLVPVLIDLFLSAPATAKCDVLPEIIQGLGRCMSTRRDNPDGAIWRLAVEGFNRILLDDLSRLNIYQRVDPAARIRMWKEVADVCELFLMGSCGRALPSDSLSPAVLKSDELLEMSFLNVLSDNILKAQNGAPRDILQRLVSTLDRCASRTSCLPVETVGLMPSQCSRFSLTCLQKLFSLCSYTSSGAEWNSTRSETSKITILVLMKRCQHILKQFIIDENELGEKLLPTVRIEETIYVLQELVRLVIHTDTASVLPLEPYLMASLSRNENCNGRAHLLVMFPSFCELVVSRETRIRELVQVLLRLISAELGLQKFMVAE